MKNQSWKFRFKHSFQHQLMSIIGDIRFCCKEGTWYELKLADWHSKLYLKQMADRRSAGIIEIENRVDWSAW